MITKGVKIQRHTHTHAKDNSCGSKKKVKLRTHFMYERYTAVKCHSMDMRIRIPHKHLSQKNPN